MSNLSAFPYIQEGAEAVPALWNTVYSVLSSNIASINTDLVSGHFQQLSIGSTPPSYATTAAVTIEVNSTQSDYLYLVDSAAQKSSYIIGSRAGGTADGLNIWDVSGATMIASFSKQSIRFFQPLVGPVFDTAGDFYNAATFIGSGSSLSGIQAAINQGSIDGKSGVLVPKSMYPYDASKISFIYSQHMIREGGNWSHNDVKAYGAFGNNTADDRAAIQAAISSLTQGGTVYLPRGTYKISSPLTVGVDGLTIDGDGYANPSGTITAHASAIQADTVASGSDAITVIGPGANSMKGNKFRNFAIQMNGAGAGGAGLKLWNCSDFLVDIVTNVNRGATSYGVQLGDLSTISRVCIAGRVNGIHVCNGTPVLVGYAATSIAVKTFTLGQATAGVLAKNATYCLLDNCASDSAIAGGYGYELDTCINVTLQSCGAEACGRARLHIKGACIGISDINGRGVGNNVDAVATAASFAQIETGGSYSLCFENPVDSTPNAATVSSISAGAGTLWTVIQGSADASVLPKGIGGDTTWSSTYLTVVNGNYIQVPVVTAGSGTFSGNVTHGTSSAGALILLNGPANQGGAKDIRFLTAGNNRWLIRADNQAESGSDAGSPLEILARTDAGGGIDTPMTIVRASGGQINFTRSLQAIAGTALLPGYAISSESSLGWYRSGASTMALSYGTLWPQGALWVTSGISTLASIVSSSYVSSTKTLMGGDFWGSSLSINVGLNVKAGANKSCGTAVLGSNGSVNVANTYVATGDLIFLTDQTPGGTLGDLEMTGIRNASGFTIASTSITDSSTVAWLIVRPT